ncbi:MAG: hypothetical protein HUU37_05645, partial [Bdellovibrionales bacterium]|nr:hypothetical protein [Bdellovibrionales bacterium]
MDFKHTILAIFAGVALSLAPQGSRAGANSSGGGNIFVKQPGSSPVLLDLVVWQPDFVDDFTGSSGRSLRLVTFRSFENTEIARVRLTDQPAYWLLQEKLNLWKSASPIVISAIEDALSSMEFYALRSGLKHQRGFSVPPVLRERYPQGVLVTAAAYGTNINGAVISAPVWDSLGVFSQAGLIVHEALRDIQLGAVDEMPDEILQETAARIILDVPHRG